MINKKVLSSPMAIVYRTVSLIKTWRPLLKMKLKPTVEEMLDLISANVH
jgi:preprotein translocase subunit Sss1